MKKILIGFLLIAFSMVSYAQNNTSNQPLEDLNLDFMLRGYFFAGSRIKDENALGGFGRSDNFPRSIDPNMSVAGGRITLIALPDDETVFLKKYRGMKLRLVNGTDEPVGFAASDSRLYIVQEAIDKNGKWKPVEYLPSSWCGNSYHTVFLGPNEYWEFAAAKFKGSYNTRLRFRLEQTTRGQKMLIYSNEFDGSVNPNQFLIQQGHKPTSIMDPYNN